MKVSPILRVLFISRKNLFRSIFCTLFFRRLIEKNDLAAQLSCTSAGTDVLTHEPPPKEIQKIGKQLGYDISHKRSLMITKQMIENNDIVIGVDSYVYKYLSKKYASKERKIFLLKEFDLDESVENPDILEQDNFADHRTLIKIIQDIEKEIGRIHPKLFQISNRKKQLADEKNRHL